MKKTLLYSLFAGLACTASSSWAMEAETIPNDAETAWLNPAGSRAEADAELTELLKQHPEVEEKIKQDFRKYYIRNFKTKYNRERLARLQKDLEERLQRLALEQEALALLAQTQCTGEPEEDKFQCALQ